MKQEKIKVVRIARLEMPEVITIPNTLQALQEQVGGLIESHYHPLPDGSELPLICNDEGKFTEQPNRPLYYEGKVYDVIYGTFLVVNVDLDTGENIDVTLDQIVKSRDAFRRMII